jgi:hypothetical protein
MQFPVYRLHAPLAIVRESNTCPPGHSRRTAGVRRSEALSAAGQFFTHCAAQLLSTAISDPTIRGLRISNTGACRVRAKLK